ncbi:hypothetical protein [Agrobacterium pusense]|nr:hypothetical protein [Agrobacterium pusense]UXT89289.1 hypothetical protein FY130_05835 [Agrobacterium pusense]
MDHQRFAEFEAILKDAKSLTQEMLKLTKRDLEKLDEMEKRLGGDWRQE